MSVILIWWLKWGYEILMWMKHRKLLFCTWTWKMRKTGETKIIIFHYCNDCKLVFPIILLYLITHSKCRQVKRIWWLLIVFYCVYLSKRHISPSSKIFSHILTGLNLKCLRSGTANDHEMYLWIEAQNIIIY